MLGVSGIWMAVALLGAKSPQGSACFTKTPEQVCVPAVKDLQGNTVKLSAPWLIVYVVNPASNSPFHQEYKRQLVVAASMNHQYQKLGLQSLVVFAGQETQETMINQYYNLRIAMPTTRVKENFQKPPVTMLYKDGKLLKNWNVYTPASELGIFLEKTIKGSDFPF